MKTTATLKNNSLYEFPLKFVFDMEDQIEGGSGKLRVALRVRPCMPAELARGAKECLGFVPGEPQVPDANPDGERDLTTFPQVLHQRQPFTYDFVFSPKSTQEEMFEQCVAPLVEGCFNGYNA